VARRRKLAKRRRGSALTEHRAEERERQQRRRSRRGEADCHAPPSEAKPSDLLEEMRQIVDGALELSRATLRRRLPRIWARCGPSAWTENTTPERMSRATLEV